MSKHVAQSDTLTLTSTKNAVVFGMILFSFIHITDTERNITGIFRESCYKKYRVNRRSGNIGLTNCTTATLTKLYKIFLRISMNYTLKGT
jgi:hypothetical protein